MAVIVKLANLLIKNKALEDVSEYLESLGEDWTRFVDGELKRSNDCNTKSLGGQQPRSNSIDDDDMEGSMSMDQILSRFSNFSTERSKKEASSHDDDDNEEEEDEDKKDEEHKKEDMVEEPNEDKLSFLRERDEEYKKEQEETDVNTASKTTIISVDIKEEPLAQEFIDSNYWNLNYLSTEKSLDELIAEMEL